MKKRLSKQERKNEIKLAASKIIATKGLEKTTMEDIIAATTLSKGGVYHYYANVIEIFQDIMMDGIAYRNTVVASHISESKNENIMEFFATQAVDKILDENSGMSLYVELLLAVKRNKQLKQLLDMLQEATRQSLINMAGKENETMFAKDTFQVMSNFMNALILSTYVLDTRQSFINNRRYLEELFLALLRGGKGNESL